MDLVLLLIGYLMFDILDSDRGSLPKLIAVGVFVVLLLFALYSTVNVAFPDGDKKPKVEEIKIEDGPKADF